MPAPSVSSPLRLGGLLVALIVAVAALAWSGQTLPLHDFVEYWAAGQLLAGGEDPYDLERVAELERQAGHTRDPFLMWNPPWTLPLVLPLGYLPVRAAHLLWLLVHLGVIVGCVELLWRHYAGPSDGGLMAHLVAWTFVPTVFSLLAGQISPLLLLGVTGFLVLGRRRHDWAAGVAAALLGIKPHLVYLFWPAVLVWAVRQRRWQVLAGGAATGVVLTAVAMAFRPTVLADYWHTMTTRPPTQYSSPTLGTIIRLVLGDAAFRWQFLPVVPGLLWLACWRPAWASREWDETLPLIVLVSVLTTPYGAWLFDLVLLLLPVVAVTAAVARVGGATRQAALGVHAAINGLAMVLWLREAEYLLFIWMTPALLLAYLAFRPRQPVMAS